MRSPGKIWSFSHAQEGLLRCYQSVQIQDKNFEIKVNTIRLINLVEFTKTKKKRNICYINDKNPQHLAIFYLLVKRIYCLNTQSITE